MSRAGKRTITATLFMAAGAAVLVALLLSGGPDSAVASRPEPAVPPPVKTAPDKKVVTPPPDKKTTEPDKTVEPDKKVVKPADPPKVDVVFALDTTGSMGGLIQGAKRKIWSIANQIVSGDPKPDVRLGLIGYRDRGDAYVTRRYQLTENIDDIYSHLKRFRANGGGDTPEHVNRALADAIRNMSWREGQNVLRLVFLVGDAPPHEGRDGLYSAKLAREAAEKGIIINAVRCGTMYRTAQVWKRIASSAGGMYASIRQDGAMVAYRSPVDDKLAELNKELSRTILPTGSASRKAAVRRRAAANMAMAPMMQAESAKFRTKSGKLDSADLLDRLGKGDSLAAMADEELPEPVAALPAAERKAYVGKVKAKRSTLQKKIADLARERDKWVKAQAKEKREAGFDDMVGAALKKQGKRIGVAY